MSRGCGIPFLFLSWLLFLLRSLFAPPPAFILGVRRRLAHTRGRQQQQQQQQRRGQPTTEGRGREAMVCRDAVAFFPLFSSPCSALLCRLASSTFPQSCCLRLSLPSPFLSRWRPEELRWRWRLTRRQRRAAAARSVSGAGDAAAKEEGGQRGAGRKKEELARGREEWASRTGRLFSLSSLAPLFFSFPLCTFFPCSLPAALLAVLLLWLRLPSRLSSSLTTTRRILLSFRKRVSPFLLALFS